MKERCHACNGTRKRRIVGGMVESCETCNGNGFLLKVAQSDEPKVDKRTKEYKESLRETA